MAPAELPRYVPNTPLEIEVTPPVDAGLCRAPDDLAQLSDHELYALESDRCLLPDEWERVEGELRRRRQGRSVLVGDVALGAVAPAVTLGDLERVAAQLEHRMAERLERIEARTRALRWWAAAAPLAWALAGLGAWALASHGGETLSTLAATLLS